MFVYDLGSTHGTFVNKKQVPAFEYVKLQPNDMVRFGQSTRWFVLSGAFEDDADEKEEERPRKKIQIVSKRQNQEFLFK